MPSNHFYSTAVFCGASLLMAGAALAQSDEEYSSQYETYEDYYQEDYYQTVGKAATTAQDPSAPVFILEGAQVFAIGDRIFITRMPVLLPNGKTVTWDLELDVDAAATGKASKVSIAKNVSSPTSTGTFNPGRYYDPATGCRVQIYPPARDSAGRLTYTVQTLPSQPSGTTPACSKGDSYTLDLSYTTGPISKHPLEPLIKTEQCTVEGINRAYGVSLRSMAFKGLDFGPGELTFMTDAGGGNVTLTSFSGSTPKCKGNTRGTTLIRCENDACLTTR